jgi:beta-lactamase regulating signal transducer with metallopeptidase domain
MDPFVVYGILSQAYTDVPRICQAMNLTKACENNTVKIFLIVGIVIFLMCTFYMIYNLVCSMIKLKGEGERKERARETRASTEEMKDFAKSSATILYAVGIEPKVKVDNIKLLISRYYSLSKSHS